MGSSQSKTDSDTKVFLNETPIQFSADVVDQLASQQASPTPSLDRQATLDEHIRSRIQAEVEKLRRDEEEVRHQIEQALEKENLDREREMASNDDGAATGGVKSSTALLGDLEEVQKKIDRFKSRKDLSEYPSVVASQKEVVECYRLNASRTLDCWKEVENFRLAVEAVEQAHLKSLR